MSNTIQAALEFDILHPKTGAGTRQAGVLTFDREEKDELIPLIREAAVREQATGIKVIGFRLVGESVRHIVDATYSDDSGTWYEHRDGICPAEAALHGAMTMVLEEGVEDEFLDRLNAAADIRIDHCAPEPVTKEEYRNALQALVREARTAGHEGPTLDEVVRLLALDGIEVEETPAPRM
jgi:hypothetical protein